MKKWPCKRFTRVLFAESMQIAIQIQLGEALHLDWENSCSSALAGCAAAGQSGMQAMSYACSTLVTPTKLHDYMNHGIYLTLIVDLSMGLKLGTLIASLYTDTNYIKLLYNKQGNALEF